MKSFSWPNFGEKFNFSLHYFYSFRASPFHVLARSTQSDSYPAWALCYSLLQRANHRSIWAKKVYHFSLGIEIEFFEERKKKPKMAMAAQTLDFSVCQEVRGAMHDGRLRMTTQTINFKDTTTGRVSSIFEFQSFYFYMLSNISLYI